MMNGSGSEQEFSSQFAMQTMHLHLKDLNLLYGLTNLAGWPAPR